jgi:ClpP class serine protease
MQGILSAITSGKWFVDEASIQGYLPVAASFLLGKRNPHVENMADERQKHKPYLISLAEPYDITDYGEGMIKNPDTAPKNSIAVIPVWGVITNDDQMSGPSGTKTKSRVLDKIATNPNVVGIVFDFDTPGGELAGTRQFAKRIYNLDKPTVGFVRNMAASAGAWIATACDRVILEDDITRMGSVGGYKQMPDYSRYFKNQGVDIKTVYAKQSKLKNKSIGRDDDTAYDKEDISDFTQIFIDDVKLFRGEKLAEDEEIFQGEMYRGQKAIDKGLADAIGSMGDAIAWINAQIGDTGNSSNTSNSNNASQTNTNDTMKIKDTWKAIAGFFGSEKEELKEEDIDQLNTELSSREEKINTLTSEKEKLEEEKKSLEEAKAQLEKDKESLEAEKTDLEKKVAEKPSTSTAKVDKEVDENTEEEYEIPSDPADEELKEML